MAFSGGGVDDRLNPSRWRKSDPPNPEALFSFQRQPLPTISTIPTINTPQNSTAASAFGDSRGNLPRRFTTSSSFASPFALRRPAGEPPVPDIPLAFQQQRVTPGDKKKAEYEFLRQKHIQRQMQLEQLAREHELGEMALRRMDHEGGLNGAGHQSEPTTPPEYRESGFPSGLSRPNRYSASNALSGGFFGRNRQDESNLSSPPNDRDQAYHALTGGTMQPLSQSKHTLDVEDGYDEILDLDHRSAASLNRNSMPVTGRDHRVKNGASDTASVLGHVNTHAFLFGDDEGTDQTAKMSAPPRPASYFHAKNADNFPVLLRQEGNGNNGGLNPASAQVPDLAPAGELEASSAPSSKRASYRRSLPAQAANGHQHTSGDSPPYGFTTSGVNDNLAASSRTSALNRHSFGTNLNPNNDQKRPGLIGSPANGTSEANGTAPKLQSSYSTSDLPTVKNTSNSTANGYSSPPSNVQTAEQRLHSHNASLGRIPASALNSNRHSRELPSGAEYQADDNSAIDSLQAILANHNSATSSHAVIHPGSAFSPPSGIQGNAVSGVNNAVSNLDASSASSITSPNMYQQYSQQQQQPYQFSPYGMPNSMNMLTAGMGGMSVNNQHPQWNGASQAYGQQYQQYNSNNYQTFSPSRASDASSRGQAQRRGQGNEDNSRFANVPLENLQGEIYSLCKDQNGCRYLQKKLEERNSAQTKMIFDETKEHMIDLMTDPFGNYLCQKLLEATSSEDHTVLINNAANHMVKIALNQHGTRALQKMIEYVTTSEQISTLIFALKDQVVPMIQDLNGNHVIQKCLNYLKAEDVQFVIDAVSNHCVVVGTHRHGCCVIQRCIDHATGQQKAQLITAIINCSFPLVQDPFGNYVLQYIFDQNEESFSQHLCRAFLGNIANLSKQKFSSNVIEKCIRIADADTRHEMIEEIVTSPEFDRLADDAFANYVVQTAWDNANPEDEARLAERIRPVLPRMRHKPYGRRFQSRIGERDKRFGIAPSADMSSPEPLSMQPSQMTSPMQSHMGANDTGFYQPTDGIYGNNNVGHMGNPGYPQHSMNNANGYNRPGSHRMSNAAFPNMNQYQGAQQMQQPQQQFAGYGRGYGGMNGMNMGMGMNNQHY